jgi:hypothetical protein
MIEDLFDLRIRVWRPIEVRGQAGDVTQALETVEDGERLNAAIVPPRLDVDNIGPGDTTRGRVDFYAGIWVDVVERDIVEVIEGSALGKVWRVTSASRPRNHHVELILEPWAGTLPEDS